MGKISHEFFEGGHLIMFNPSIKERIINAIKMRIMKFTASSKRKQLNNTDFSIISNNCWGG